MSGSREPLLFGENSLSLWMWHKENCFGKGFWDIPVWMQLLPGTNPSACRALGSHAQSNSLILPHCWGKWTLCVLFARQFNAVFRQESHIPKQTAVNGTDQLDWCGLCWAPCSVKGEAGTALFVPPERSGSATSAVCGSERPWAGPRELGFCVPVRSVGSTHCKLVAEGLRCNSDTPWKSPVPGNVQSQRKPVS